MVCGFHFGACTYFHEKFSASRGLSSFLPLRSGKQGSDIRISPVIYTKCTHKFPRQPSISTFLAEYDAVELGLYFSLSLVIESRPPAGISGYRHSKNLTRQTSSRLMDSICTAATAFPAVAMLRAPRTAESRIAKLGNLARYEYHLPEHVLHQKVMHIRTAAALFAPRGKRCSGPASRIR